MALALVLSLGMMFTWQAYLIATNQTTVEFYDNRYWSAKARSRGKVFYNVYDLGIRRNFREFFDIPEGSSLLWGLLPHVKGHRGTGLEFPVGHQNAFEDFSV